MKLARFISRRPGRVLLAAFAAAALALVPASRLRLETRLEALLPEGSPAAEGYRDFLERFGGAEKVFVLLLAPEGASPPPGLLTRASSLLVRHLEASPEVLDARGGFEPADQAFFLRSVLPRAALLLGEDFHHAVAARLEPAEIRRRVAEVRLGSGTPRGLLMAPLWARDPLGLAEDLPALSGLWPGAGKGAAATARTGLSPLSPAWLSDDGAAALVMVTPARSEMDPEGGRALQAALDEAYGALRSELGAAARNLGITAVGGPLYAAQDEALLRGDLQRTIAGSLLICGVLLLLAFGGPRVPLAGLLALGLGLLWAAGFLGAVTPQRTAVSLGFAAVLVGLGLDYTIHGGVRFQQLLGAGVGRAEALGSTFRQAGPGILTSALTTAAAFAVLALASFRPLRELGELVAVGILSILAASATAGAALLIFPLRPTETSGGRLWRLLGVGVSGAVALARRRPRWTLTVALAMSLLAAVGLPKLRLDGDLAAIRPAAHPALRAERLLAERFGMGSDTATVVIPGRDLYEVLERTTRARILLAQAAGPEALITAPSDWLGPGGRQDARRLEELRGFPLARAVEIFEAEVSAAGLSAAAFSPGLESLRKLARGEDPVPSFPSGVVPGTSGPGSGVAGPAWLAELLRRPGSGELGAWGAIRLRLPAGLWPEGPPGDLMAALEEAAPGCTVASAPRLGQELKALARSDLLSLGEFALAAVALVVWLSFRGRFLPAVLALTPVALGSFWTLGLWGLSGLEALSGLWGMDALGGGRIDLLSLTVLPILLGIGIDDGLHALHGVSREGSGEGRLSASVADAGRAMALTTLTTAAGFASLALSSVPGLRRGGVLVATGVLACLAATLFVLPALEASFIEARRSRT